MNSQGNKDGFWHDFFRVGYPMPPALLLLLVAVLTLAVAITS